MGTKCTQYSESRKFFAPQSKGYWNDGGTPCCKLLVSSADTACMANGETRDNSWYNHTD